MVDFEYYTTDKYVGSSIPCFSITMYKNMQTHGGKNREHNIGINIYVLSNFYDKEGNLKSDDEIQLIVNNGNVTDDIIEALRLAIVDLFGEKEGNDFTKYIIAEYIKRMSDETTKTYIDNYEKKTVGKYNVIISDYVDRTTNTWGHSTYYDFIVK